MLRHFEAAERMENGQVVTRFDQVSGQAVVERWDIKPENMPVFRPGTGYAVIRSAEDVIIPSVWKGFLGVANTGMSSIANKLNSLLGAVPQAGAINTPDYNKPFKPVEIHTGLKVVMPKNEVLQFVVTTQNASNGLMLVGGQAVTGDRANNEITLLFYNMLSSDITIQVGDELAFGFFTELKGIALANTQFVDDTQTVPTPKPMPIGTPMPIGAPMPMNINLNK